MSYNKQTWNNGDVITEGKLNHIEKGIDDAHDLIENLESDVLDNDIKQALLNCFAHVAWTDEHGQDYYDALEDALYPPVQVYSINAVYTQSGAVYTTDTLESLKSDLVVTALYDDATTEVITNYTLSGTLTAGVSTITVSYGGKTDTFEVTVTEIILNYIDAVFTQGSEVIYDTDSLDDLKQYLVVTAYYSDSTSAVVNDYTLSGTLTEGTSTITVTYNGLIDTFDVTVTHKQASGDNVWYDGVAYENLTIVQNEYVQASNGEIKQYTGWDRTVYVYCEGASSITFPPMPEQSGYAPRSNAFYKNNTGTWESQFTLSKTETTTITVPSGAKYFAISSESAALAACINAGIVPHA